LKTNSSISANKKLLSSQELEVLINLDRGCEVLSIKHLSSDSQVLFQAPWAPRSAPWTQTFGDSGLDWIYGYNGGWQILAPNISSSDEDVTQKEIFGESALLPWELRELSDSSLTATVNLVSVPLTIERKITIQGERLIINERITNTSPIVQEIRWMHHPAFGAPFVEPGVRVLSGARKVIFDPDREPYSANHEICDLIDMRSFEADLDLSVIPTDSRDIFATLADFEHGYFALINERIDLGVIVEWDKEIYPYAWFWQDLQKNPDFPWFGRAYVTAIEPSCAIPGRGKCGDYQRNEAIVLQPFNSISTEISLTIFQNVSEDTRVEEILSLTINQPKEKS